MELMEELILGMKMKWKNRKNITNYERREGKKGRRMKGESKGEEGGSEGGENLWMQVCVYS